MIGDDLFEMLFDCDGRIALSNYVSLLLNTLFVRTVTYKYISLLYLKSLITQMPKHQHKNFQKKSMQSKASNRTQR